jgi:hypothetical protein
MAISPAPDAEFIPSGKSPFDNRLSVGQSDHLGAQFFQSIRVSGPDVKGCIVPRIKTPTARQQLAPIRYGGCIVPFAVPHY